MASQQVQQPPTIPSPPTGIPVEIPADSSVWDRISSWVSEHKAVVYTIAGVTVAVAAGGVIYYSTNSVRGASHYLPSLDPTSCLQWSIFACLVCIKHKTNHSYLTRLPKIPPRSYPKRRGGSARRPSARLKPSAMLPRQILLRPHLRSPAATAAMRFPRLPRRPS